jgi:hypothetical protein
MLPTCLRCLPSCTLPGTWQMAMDAWLLDQVVAGRREGPLLRFYRWSRPTLSLGKHQRAVDPRWLRLVAAGKLEMVRRPSGGSAVLHGGDLTYALIWPDPPRQRREAYRLSCRWLQEAFAAMDLPLRFGETPCRSDQAHCFASSTAADLVHSSAVARALPVATRQCGPCPRCRPLGSRVRRTSPMPPVPTALGRVIGGPSPRFCPALVSLGHRGGGCWSRRCAHGGSPGLGVGRDHRQPRPL